MTSSRVFIAAGSTKSARRHRPCPVCLTEESIHLRRASIAPVDGMDFSYDVVSCNGCGFVYGNNLATQVEYENYYQSLSKYDADISVANISDVDWLRARTAVQICAGASGPVIDIGCGGAGVLLSAFRDAGIGPVYGLDPAKSDAAQALFGLTTIKRGVVADAPVLFELASFDLVCLTGVLEHLVDLRVEMESITNALAPGARVLVEVPALERFDKQPAEPYGELSIEHINFFSANALQRLFQAFGFSLLTKHILPLPAGWADSLYMLFEKTSLSTSTTTEDQKRQLADADRMQAYLVTSEGLIAKVLNKLKQTKTNESWVIFGAGSHTARLLPRLEEAGLASRIRMVVDSNPNLQGKTIGKWKIFAPSILADYAADTIVISSFRSQRGIRQYLETQFTNQIISLYEDNNA